jgi:polysaccharide pyruvyl transferase WcaK-like protein
MNQPVNQTPGLADEANRTPTRCATIGALTREATQQHTPPVSYCLAGAALDTNNLGVSALAMALTQQLAQRVRGQMTFLDHGNPVDPQSWPPSDALTLHRCRAVHSRRFYRADCLWRIRLANRMGGAGNPAAQHLRRADALLAISGGDSFAQIYGRHRFHAMALPALIALEAGTPLIMMPQTYGPFHDRRCHNLAQRIVRGAHMAWARDAESLAMLRQLLGDAYDPAIHRQGVDVAFALEPQPPALARRQMLLDWLDSGPPTVGLNISGLVFNDPKRAARTYGLKADYPKAMLQLVYRLLRQSDAKILLIPHVNAPKDHPNSDSAACEAVRAACRSSDQHRVMVAPELASPAEAKWLIARCDWFCGTRMHSCIAALSSNVPTAAVAYSDKTRGVFATCGLASHVADPRRQRTDAITEKLLASWRRREEARRILSDHLPEIDAQAQRQIDQLVTATRPHDRSETTTSCTG